jgi:hypothetical protein
LACASPLFAVTSATDGTFSNWSFSSVGAASMTVDPANGNPTPGLNVTTTTALTPVFVYGIGVDLDFSTTAALSGIFSLGVDVKSGPNGFGAGQAVSLIVQQGSDLYSEIPGTTTFPHTNFDTLSFSGTFNSALFTHVIGSGAAAPNFSGGTTTFFGLAGINSNNGPTLTEYYDNFHLTYDLTSTPGPRHSRLPG